MTRDPRSQAALPHSAPDPFKSAEGSLEASVVQVADLLQNTRYRIALTGTGISAESGIPTYRAKTAFGPSTANRLSANRFMIAVPA